MNTEILFKLWQYKKNRALTVPGSASLQSHLSGRFNNYTCERESSCHFYQEPPTGVVHLKCVMLKSVIIGNYVLPSKMPPGGWGLCNKGELFLWQPSTNQAFVLNDYWMQRENTPSTSCLTHVTLLKYGFRLSLIVHLCHRQLKISPFFSLWCFRKPFLQLLFEKLFFSCSLYKALCSSNPLASDWPAMGRFLVFQALLHVIDQLQDPYAMISFLAVSEQIQRFSLT